MASLNLFFPNWKNSLLTGNASLSTTFNTIHSHKTVWCNGQRSDDQPSEGVLSFKITQGNYQLAEIFNRLIRHRVLSRLLCLSNQYGLQNLIGFGMESKNLLISRVMHGDDMYHAFGDPFLRVKSYDDGDRQVSGSHQVLDGFCQKWVKYNFIFSWCSFWANTLFLPKWIVRFGILWH